MISFPAMKQSKSRIRIKRRSAAVHDSPKVLISISLAHASWRDFLSGILRYVEKHANWDIRIMHEPGDLLARQIDDAEHNGYAGIILATPGDIDFDHLCRSSIPLADCDGRPELRRRKRSIVHMLLDNAAIGTVGARHLLGRGRCAAYGFVCSHFDMDWSGERQAAFIETVRAAGEKAVCYKPPQGATEGSDIVELHDWIASLPRPAAVMADCDRRAAQVIAACHDARLSVPQDVAVLGVDDDAFFAMHTNPPISSVVPDHVGLGYRTATELDRLIKARKTSCAPKQICIQPKGVVARTSTSPISSASALARRTAAFICANAAHGIKVADVVRHLGCSRRIAELRFQQVEKRTIADFISECRLKEVCRRLRATDMTVAAIARECGFKSAAHVSNLFKKRFGQSITDWRANNRQR